MIFLRRLLIFWTLFNGVGAIAGATGMITDSTGEALGMDAMLPFFSEAANGPLVVS